MQAHRDSGDDCHPGGDREPGTTGDHRLLTASITVKRQNTEGRNIQIPGASKGSLWNKMCPPPPDCLSVWRRAGLPAFLQWIQI